MTWLKWIAKTSLFTISLFLVHTPLFAHSYQPVMQFSYVLFSNEPTSLKGFQLFWQLQQTDLFWRRFQLIFDVGLSHLEHHCESDRELTIFSVAPLLRYHFKPRLSHQLYFDISIGAAYLNHTQMENRNLGTHFAFQDRIGIGVLFGNHNQYNIGIHAVHYSNASLAKHNAGITMPIVLDFGIKL